ncbi:MAG: rhodanese-like domain-containing protein [Chloroflexota bacterium]
MAFLTTTSHSYDHVSYYPGATQQAVNLLYAPADGRLLGAQVVGRNAVDRTIGVLATAITAKMTVFDLEHLELAYVPPYGAAKDPVNIAGYVASNQLRGDSEPVTWQQAAQRDPERVGLLDVRTAPEFDTGHIEGSVKFPLDELRGRLDELSPEKDWIVACAVGKRAYAAERALRQRGYRARNLIGGLATYGPATASAPQLDEETQA